VLGDGRWAVWLCRIAFRGPSRFATLPQFSPVPLGTATVSVLDAGTDRTGFLASCLISFTAQAPSTDPERLCRAT
jgi:hypothetical protein